MSRTIRRKNYWADEVYFITHDCEWIDGWSIWIKKEEKDIKKGLALFHSDSHNCCGYVDGSVPRWYTRMFNRQKRAKANHKIRNFIRNYDPEVDLVFELWKKDAAQHYW
jgi:hypothetical protein